MDPVRVLHITETLTAAGIESFIMNLYRHIDREKVQFDFLVLRNAKEFYEDEITKLGGKKYWIHSEKNNTLLRILEESKLLEDFLKKHKYDIVHIHYTTPLRAPYLKACYRAGVSTRIYHSHSAYVSGKSSIKMAIYSYMQRVIERYGTDFFACSKVAAEWMYRRSLIESGKTKVIYNGIDTEKFAYNEISRTKIREELGISNEDFTIIHTGRFTEQKNQKFVIEVFKEICKKENNAKLLLLGEGDLMEDVQQMVREADLSADVFFLGLRSNVFDYLCAADVYVMPSLYEGLPVAAVEAQCSGLPCVVSSNITEEIKLTENVEFLSLSEPISKWAETILRYRNWKRKTENDGVRRVGYDMSDVAHSMEQFYIKRSKNA